MWRGTELVGMLALLLLLRGPALTSAAWTNAGMLSLRDALLSRADDVPGNYPLYAVLDETPATDRAMKNLRRAANLNENGLTPRWALGRAALALGDEEVAAGALEPLVKKAEINPLLYLDMLSVSSYGGQPKDVIALYETYPLPQHTQAISDAVALAYLERSRVAERPGDPEALVSAAALHPGDLYANYHLWRAAVESGDAQTTAVYSETLVYFPLEAVHPTDDRLLDYAAEVIPALLEEGLWDRGKTLNVASFLVWQHNRAGGVERLLKRLIERYPTEPDWPFYLAELYHRRGDLDRAEAAYRQVLALDQNYAQAYLRIGMLYEAWAEEGMEE